MPLNDRVACMNECQLGLNFAGGMHSADTQVLHLVRIHVLRVQVVIATRGRVSLVVSSIYGLVEVVC